MWKLNFKNEFLRLFRNRWFTGLSILLVVLCLYAGFNGKQRVLERTNSIDGAIQEMRDQDALVAAQLDSLDQGLEINLPTWQYPNSPTATGDRNPRVAAFKPDNLTFISTGQSDIFNHYVKPGLTSDKFSLSFTELTSPVSLLLGQFDPAFVVIYLFPLLIISFTYNVLSSEKEQGSLTLVASNPVKVKLWLFQKINIRFIILSSLMISALVLMFIVWGVEFKLNLITFLLVTVLYSAFWYVLAFLINLRGKSSSHNAISLIGLWVIFVLAIPSLLSQTANSLYPVPSRSLMINEMRMLQSEIDKEQDAILDDFLRNHPELITREAEESTAYGWWQRYFASKDVLSDRMDPLLATYEGNLTKQQASVNRFSFLSPAILAQNCLNDLARTSPAYYQAYKEQVLSFSEEWREFFLPLVFQDRAFEKNMISELPSFHFEAGKVQSSIFTNTIWLLAIVLGLILIAFNSKTIGELQQVMHK